MTPGSVRSSVHAYISNLRGRDRWHDRAHRAGVPPPSPSRFHRRRHVRTPCGSAHASLASSPDRAAETLREALSLWRGRPYADLIDVPGLQDEIRRLEALRLLAVESRVDADLANGRHAAVIGQLEALATEFPLREGFRSRRMDRALSGRTAGRGASGIHHETREYLADELGIEPTPELRELERADPGTRRTASLSP